MGKILALFVLVVIWVIFWNSLLEKKHEEHRKKGGDYLEPRK